MTFSRAPRVSAACAKEVFSFSPTLTTKLQSAPTAPFLHRHATRIKSFFDLVPGVGSLMPRQSWNAHSDPRGVQEVIRLDKRRAHLATTAPCVVFVTSIFTPKTTCATIVKGGNHQHTNNLFTIKLARFYQIIPNRTFNYQQFFQK